MPGSDPPPLARRIASFPLDCSLPKSDYPHVAQVGGGTRVHQASHIHIYIAVMGS